MQEILDRLGFAVVSKQDRPLLTEDFVFSPSDYPSANELRIVHEEVMLEETPLALVRLVHLEHATRPHTSIRLRLVLCWNGFRDALTLLARFSQSFQRAIPPTAVVNSAERYGAGDFGVAWRWTGEGEPDILGFVKNNVFVSLEGHDAAGVVGPLARGLSEALGRLRTGAAYADVPAEQLAGVRSRTEGIPRVPRGGRLEIGVLPEDGSSFFFLTTSGSVNRSPDRSGAWYYRAGNERGPQTVTLFRTGKGILPVRDRLTIEVN